MSSDSPCYISVAIDVPLNIIFTYTYNNPQDLQIGQRVLLPFGDSNREVKAIVLAIDVDYNLEFATKEIISIIDNKPLLNDYLIELAYKIADYNFCSLGEVLFAMLPNAKVEKEPNYYIGSESGKPNFTINKEQEMAINIINSRAGNYYLHGVTGSGKTIVFIELIKRHLALGGSVIYLVPEISLTYQTVSLFKYFFNDFNLIHSGITPSQRLKEWRNIQEKSSVLVIGTRSAIFAPCNNLSLIILDEEHDSSYKSSATPRFNARQVAMMRQKMSNATLVMGSATPSLESFKACADGIFNLVELKERFNHIKPVLQIVDMRSERHIFSKELVTQVLQTHALGKQTILFLNRKGFSKYFECADCQALVECKHCSVALTYHQGKKRLVCHYCGYQEAVQRVCKKCGSLNVEYKAFGLEKVGEEADKFFAGLKIDYLDGDIVRNRNGGAKEILERFKKGESDLLLATQVVAKGFNFPNLRLIGIVLADVGLAMPDFRAEERSFAMLEQIAGRSARFGEEGLVIVQTYRPNNRVIDGIVKQDFTEFYKNLLVDREDNFWPPYSRLIKIVFRSKKEDSAKLAATQFADGFRDYLPASYGEIFGPIESVIKKVADVYRYQVIIRGSSYDLLKTSLYNYLGDKNTVINGVYREIDGDPVSLI